MANDIGMMGMEDYNEPMAPDTGAMAPDEIGVEQGQVEDERAALELAIEQFPVVGTIIERLMEAAAPPKESPEDTVKANLEPGEFVFTSDAVKEIGVGKLQSMMEKAEQGFMEKQGGKPVEGGEEMAFAAGGYVNELGERGFVEQMYKQGKETQENLLHKESGFNYQEGGVAGEQYMKGQERGSIWNRLTTGIMGGGEEAPALAPQVDPRIQYINTHPDVVQSIKDSDADPQSKYKREMVDYYKEQAISDWETMQKYK